MKGFSARSRGTAIYTILPCCSARWRIARCGESGLALIVFAFFQKGLSASNLAQASAPTKLGMRPLAPGKRAAFLISRSDQIWFRISSLDCTRYKYHRKARILNRAETADENSKFEIRNSKQIQMLKKGSVDKCFAFGISRFWFLSDFRIQISDFRYSRVAAAD